MPDSLWSVETGVDLVVFVDPCFKSSFWWCILVREAFVYPFGDALHECTGGTETKKTDLVRIY